jgi:hypothetical protein
MLIQSVELDRLAGVVTGWEVCPLAGAWGFKWRGRGMTGPWLKPVLAGYGRIFLRAILRRLLLTVWVPGDCPTGPSPPAWRARICPERPANVRECPRFGKAMGMGRWLERVRRCLRGLG